MTDKQVLRDFVFKRAVAEVDELINLAPGEPELLLARKHLISAGPARMAFDPIAIAPKISEEAPARGYVFWSDEEDASLRREWEVNLPIFEIAMVHQRKPGAIAARLEKLGLVASKHTVLEDTPRDSGVLAQKIQNSSATAGPLDFEGDWFTEDGARAWVENKTEHGTWVGSITIRGNTWPGHWDETGKTLIGGSGGNLKTRIREGKNYR